MNEVELLDRINDDIRISTAQTVIYLEGTTDPEFFFALLGLPTNPADGVHRGVLVRGLKDDPKRRGSGSAAVRNLVDVASRNRVPGIFGVIDGDGRKLEELAPRFDPSYPGPLFHWKAYCIENLIAKTGWPSVWGDEPDWVAELSRYGPYVALNRIVLEVRSIVKELELESYSKPSLGSPMKQAAEVARALGEGKHRIQEYDVEQRFASEFADFEGLVRSNLDEAHALLNGKWLFQHMAPTLTRRDPDLCRFEWLAHARSVGGLPEVRDWWERVTGFPP